MLPCSLVSSLLSSFFFLFFSLAGEGGYLLSGLCESRLIHPSAKIARLWGVSKLKKMIFRQRADTGVASDYFIVLATNTVPHVSGTRVGNC